MRGQMVVQMGVACKVLCVHGSSRTMASCTCTASGAQAAVGSYRHRHDWGVPELRMQLLSVLACA